MKNNFGKATALIMGLLMILSGQALAFSSDNQELSHAEALAESKILIAQNGELSQEDFDAISQLAVKVQTTIGDLLVRLNSVAESDLPGKNAISQVLFDFQSTLGNLVVLAENQALTEGELTAITQTLANLLTTFGDISVPLSTTPRSEEDRAVAQTVIQVKTTLANFVLLIESIAQSGSYDDFDT